MGIEDRLEMEKLEERLRLEELEDKNGAAQQKEQFTRAIREQLIEDRKIAAERQRKEKILDDLFARLNNAEVAKENIKMASAAAQIYKEQQLFREFLEKVKIERAEEERRIERIAMESALKYQEQLEDQRCAVKNHWKDVQKVN